MSLTGQQNQLVKDSAANFLKFMNAHGIPATHMALTISDPEEDARRESEAAGYDRLAEASREPAMKAEYRKRAASLRKETEKDA